MQAFEIYPKGHILGDYFSPTIEAGKSEDLVVVLANTGTVAFSGRTYATNAHTAVNGGFTVAEADEAPAGVTLWLDYPEQVYDIAPGTGIERTFTVKVPKGTAPGQYITALVLEDAEPQAIESTGGAGTFNQIVRFPVPVFITVPGDVEPGFTVRNATIIATESASEISIQVENTGNVRVRPAGSVTIVDPSGNELYTVPVTMGSVYARDQTNLVLDIPGVLPAGDYTLRIDLTDPETKVTVDSTLTITSAAEATPVATLPVQIVQATANPRPDLEHLQFLDIAVTIDNAGEPLTNGQVVLRVTHDGKAVEDFPLASSLSLPGGETSVQARYIPATGWSPGTWDFEVIVQAVDAGTGAARALTTKTLDSIRVPG